MRPSRPSAACARRWIAAWPTDGARLLGGDISIESGAQPLPDALRQWLTERGARVSDVVLLRTLAVAPSGERVLVELKAVDQAYPLLGAPALDPAIRCRARWTAAWRPIRWCCSGCGCTSATRCAWARPASWCAPLVSEPDHAGGLSLLGPRVMIAASGLGATGLVQPGSLLTHDLRVRLPAGAARRR